MKLRSLADLQQPDEVVRRFTSLGFSTGGMLSAEDAAEYQQRVIATAELVDHVPDGVRDAFERLRTLHSHGVLCYDAFTAVVDLAPRVAELAVRERFVLFNNGSVEAVDKHGNVSAIAFQTVNELVDALKRRKARLVDWPQNEQFVGGYAQLLRWARRASLLAGQRARHAERRLADWRNLLAHPDGHHLLMPVDSARDIRDLAEFINRLWGAPTQGGRLYPGALQREVLALAYTGSGDTSVGLAESLDFHPSLAAATVLMVLGHREDEGLFDFDSDYEKTRFPTEMLWGPGSYSAARDWFHAQAPGGDEIDYLDRCFVIRRCGGRFDAPRSPAVAAGLSPVDRDGHWYAVRADFPMDAAVHVNGAHEPFPGPCNLCSAEGIGQGNWSDVVALVAEQGESVTPVNRPGVRMPGRWQL